MTSATRALVGALAALTMMGGAPALASEPASGSVDIYKPTLSWTGTAAGSAINLAHFFWGEQIVDDCRSPYCDAFTLTVVDDKQKVEISAIDDEGYGYTEMQIKDASGSEIFWSEGDADVPTVYTNTKMPKGTYTIEILTDHLAPVIDPGEYTGSVKMNNGVAVTPPAS